MSTDKDSEAELSPHTKFMIQNIIAVDRAMLKDEEDIKTWQRMRKEIGARTPGKEALARMVWSMTKQLYRLYKVFHKLLSIFEVRPKLF